MYAVKFCSSAPASADEEIILDERPEFLGVPTKSDALILVSAHTEACRPGTPKRYWSFFSSVLPAVCTSSNPQGAAARTRQVVAQSTGLAEKPGCVQGYVSVARPIGSTKLFYPWGVWGALGIGAGSEP
jgi:hypothetical protein